MDDAHLAVLLETVDGEGEAECDGLRVERENGTYRLSTPESSREDLDEAGLRDALADHPRLVSNWHFWARRAPGGEADRAFCRWLEGADDHGVDERYDALDDGVTRSWGQLAVTARLDDDHTRRYELRHEDDAGVDAADLTHHEDPFDARDIATEDECGRYRPLKTAPTLRTGWVFADLDARAMVRAVDLFYPATVANWHRERQGDLDVTHYRETAERQTGIYDLVDELPGEAVEWVAEACCVDSQCLKRREWDESAVDELDAPRGDGEFPCREPCSLVVAATRQWTILEGESPRTYEFELTPSEKGQLEELVDAVADGRVDEIREADVYEGANRYRARYLRAKLFDEDGTLAGVEATDGE